MLHIGPKPVNVSISWDNFAAENRQIIEPISNRYSFVENPILLTVKDVKKNITTRLPKHPDHPNRGDRVHVLEPIHEKIQLNLSRNDLDMVEENKLVRLMGLSNIKIIKVGDEITAEYHSEDYRIARDENAPFLNWLPYGTGVEAKVVMPDASYAEGLAEESVQKMKPNTMFQFERFGYCRVDQNTPFIAYFSHK
jgi:glutamyl-tRNA synthetase